MIIPTRPALFLASLFLTQAPVVAKAAGEEMWLTEFGLIQWEESDGSTAIFNLIGPEVAGPATLRLFIEGLAEHTYRGRSVYLGYWTAEDGDVGCTVELTDRMGTTTAHWGRLQVLFVTESPPSAWVALMGECWQEPDFHLTAQPLLVPPDMP